MPFTTTNNRLEEDGDSDSGSDSSSIGGSGSGSGEFCLLFNDYSHFLSYYIFYLI